jgi:flagellar FliJ protein
MSVKQLTLVLELEERKESQALHAFQQAQVHANQQQVKLDQLEQYRQQYIQGILDDASLGIRSGQYQQSLSFVGQLDKACEQQSRQMNQSKLVQTQRQTIWQQTQQKRKAIEQLIAKKQALLTAQRLRKEQAVHDDFAIQRFLRNKSIF